MLVNSSVSEARLYPPPGLRGIASVADRLALALGNWAGLLAMLLLPGSAFGYRIAVEQTALLSTLGEPYARYMRRNWRLIPNLF
jgi:protein-S-isoprenylcysteine O-methyltransferase Ste14